MRIVRQDCSRNRIATIPTEYAVPMDIVPQICFASIQWIGLTTT